MGVRGEVRRGNVAPGGLRGVSEGLAVIGVVIGMSGLDERGETVSVLQALLTVRGVDGIREVFLVGCVILCVRAFFGCIGRHSGGRNRHVREMYDEIG